MTQTATPSVSTNRPDIVLSEPERDARALSPENRKLAGLLLNCRGFVILRHALPVALIDRVRLAFADLFEDCQTSPNDRTRKIRTSQRTATVFWERASRFRIFPRLTPPFGEPELSANPFAMPLLEDVLGEGFYCKFLSSDTCVKGAILQSPHRDIEFYKSADPYGCMVNIPLSHCSTHNGPLEVWPSSHHWKEEAFTRCGMAPYVQDGRNRAIEMFADHFPSQFIEMWPGDLLLRDPGMWHRGTPNESHDPRTMLTIGYFRSDYAYGYADPRYNVDEPLLETLDPAVRELFKSSLSKDPRA